MSIQNLSRRRPGHVAAILLLLVMASGRHLAHAQTAALQVLYAFPGDGNSGATPVASLVLGSDGSLYGTTAGGGASGAGTVFRVTTNGVFNLLATFNGTNGASPFGGVTLGPDGNFYGTTESGGSNGDGTVFKVATNGL